jgi:hypothetical protein
MRATLQTSCFLSFSIEIPREASVSGEIGELVPGRLLGQFAHSFCRDLDHSQPVIRTIVMSFSVRAYLQVFLWLIEISPDLSHAV